MNKESFVNELRSKLKRLPKEEVENVISYYLDYFDDAEKSEEEVIRELGSPSTIASEILADYVFSPEKSKENKGVGNKVLLIVLAIFAAPIALPLAIALVAVIFAFIIVIGTLIFTFGIVSIALFFAGGAVVVSGGATLFRWPATGIFNIGIGLIIIGVGILVIVGMKFLLPKAYKFIGEITKKGLRKINKSKGNE